MSCSQCIGIEAQFNDKVARRDLKRYLRSGPKKTTTILLQELRKVAISGRSLMDIGGGIGAIQHAFAEEGASFVTNVDASPAYTATARSQADRMGYVDRTQYLEGDFVDLAQEVAPADFVTMDRVICCYHDMPALLGPAAAKARICLGLVFPLEHWWIRGGSRVANLLFRMFGKDFQSFVHPHEAVEACVAQSGLTLRSSASSGIWRVAVFERLST